MTVYPPTRGHGSNALPSRATTVVVPNEVVTVDLEMKVPALPSGSSLESATIGMQTSGVPRIYWAEPTIYRTTGCQNGMGVASVTTAAGEEHSFVMPESPTGSGHYSVTIPPLSPSHGEMSVNTSIVCTAYSSSFLPGGGPARGGNTVLMHIESTSAPTEFLFGSTRSPAVKTVSSGLYEVTAPAGTGDVEVSVRFQDGTSRTLDNYHYLTAQSTPSSGPANGGETLTILGDGFGPKTLVFFGQRPAAEVSVVSPQKLQVTVPSGSGTVPVTVLSNGGSTSAGIHRYQGDLTIVSGASIPACSDARPWCSYAGSW